MPNTIPHFVSAEPAPALSDRRFVFRDILYTVNVRCSLVIDAPTFAEAMEELCDPPLCVSDIDDLLEVELQDGFLEDATIIELQREGSTQQPRPLLVSGKVESNRPGEKIIFSAFQTLEEWEAGNE